MYVWLCLVGIYIYIFYIICNMFICTCLDLYDVYMIYFLILQVYMICIHSHLHISSYRLMIGGFVISYTYNGFDC